MLLFVHGWENDDQHFQSWDPMGPQFFTLSVDLATLADFVTFDILKVESHVTHDSSLGSQIIVKFDSDPSQQMISKDQG